MNKIAMNTIIDRSTFTTGVAVALLLAAAAVLLAQRFDRWERLLQAGDGEPPRNRPE